MTDEQQKATDPEEQEGKSRNRLKDAMWDYYTTNREITKQYDQQHEEEKKGQNGKKSKWSNREKTYVVVIAICAVLIIVKYVIL